MSAAWAAGTCLPINRSFQAIPAPIKIVPKRLQLWLRRYQSYQRLHQHHQQPSANRLLQWASGMPLMTYSSTSWGTEIMIDNETHNHGPQNGTGAVTIDGIAYHALQVNSGFIVLANDTQSNPVAVNILHVLPMADLQGWIQSTNTITGIAYGV